MKQKRGSRYADYPHPIRLFVGDDIEIKALAELLQRPVEQLIRELVRAGIKALRQKGMISPSSVIQFKYDDTPIAVGFPPDRNQIAIIEEKHVPDPSSTPKLPHKPLVKKSAPKKQQDVP